MMKTKIVKENVLPTIQKAVNGLVDAVRPTYGPASNKVIISKQTHAMVVDDGVQIARDYSVDDPVENAIVRLVRETAIKTNDRVGDGTTGALMMVNAIINEVARKTKYNGRSIELELKKGLEEVRKHLNESKKEITTKEELKKVASVSFDNEEIAELIADLYFKLGKDATITISKSQTMDTKVEMNNGITLDKGYISPYMITNPNRMESVIEKPYILITDYRLTGAEHILPIMNKLVNKEIRELVVICENMEQSAMSSAIVNKARGQFTLVAINAPSGANRKVVLEDLALMVGARMISEQKGDKMEEVEIEDLGQAESFTAKREESIIVGPKGEKVSISVAVEAIRDAIKKETNEKEKKELERRLGFFTNTLAVIKVGALTENEQKALKYKVEDAVNAVKAAYRNGVVCGSGLALARIETSSSILNEALKFPARQLRENMGLDDVLDLEEGKAYNVVTGEKGDYMDVGVIDPVDVLIAGVESAVSIASVMITSSGIIVDYEDKES